VRRVRRRRVGSFLLVDTALRVFLAALNELLVVFRGAAPSDADDGTAASTAGAAPSDADDGTAASTAGAAPSDADDGTAASTAGPAPPPGAS
jgi:hypothetical protein